MARLPPLHPVGASSTRWTRRDPLVLILAVWLVTRVLLVVFCPEAVHLHSEEDYIGAAGSYWRRHAALLPVWYFQYSPYEGGSVWVNTLTGLAQWVFGENVFALKTPPLLLGLFSVGATYRFVEWVAGRTPAVVTGLLLLLPPVNILIEELKNDGLHYDSTGFLFAGVLAMGTLTADAHAGARRRMATGLLLGVGLFFSYQCLPAYLAAILAWILARDRGAGDLVQRGARLLRHGVEIGIGVAVGVAPHIWMRLQLGAGAFGVYDLQDPDYRFRIQIWRIPQRFLEPIWLNPYHEAPTLRPPPLSIEDVHWVAPVILGSFLALSILRAPSFIACLRALLPGAERRAPTAAAFGAPWLVLFPFAYTIATEWNPQGFAWHYYPLYPLVAAAMGLLAGAVVAGATTQRLVRILGVVGVLAWVPLLGAHARGVGMMLELRGEPELGLSRAASDALLTRFLIWNWIPHADGPEAIRDRLLDAEFDRRPELLSMLGHSLGGRLPDGFDDRLTGWERASFHRGFRAGSRRPLVVGPSVPNEWPAHVFRALGVPGDDACTRAGRAMGDGLASIWKGDGDGSPSVSTEPAAWYHFGRGLGIGEKVDKDRTDSVFRRMPVPYDAVSEAARAAGEHQAAFWRGFGHQLGLGGVLVQHRELPKSLDDDALRAVFEGIGFVRSHRLAESTRRITNRWFPLAAAEGLRVGLGRAEQRARTECAPDGLL
jgi:hypothetical protein